MIKKAFKILNFADYTANNAELDKYKVINKYFSISNLTIDIHFNMHVCDYCRIVLFVCKHVVYKTVI